MAGTLSTGVTAFAFTTDAGEVQGCIQIFKTDQNTGGFLQVFVSCAPAQLTVADGLGSATFSATFNDIEAVSGRGNDCKSGLAIVRNRKSANNYTK